jgi:hypothetical protein
MEEENSDQQITREETFQLIQFCTNLVDAQNVEELAQTIINSIPSLNGGAPVVMHIDDSRLTKPLFFFRGIDTDLVHHLHENLTAYCMGLSAHPEAACVDLAMPVNGKLEHGILYPLQTTNVELGYLLLGAPTQPAAAPKVSTKLWPGMVNLIAAALDKMIDRSRHERQLAHLNTYLTVSSMLAQPLGLQELMETVLYCCLDVASAEEASVLLLDDSKKNFSFYQVGGPSKPLLMGATFPADRGIAGSVLETQQPGIINDVQHDLRFYGDIDIKSGSKTRNMIAIPLTAGEERIGVLEVLNKTEGAAFTEEEYLMLLSIAEEIAFAIRNAKIFEYVVNSYCKQRQGLNSCKGCKRPLGSWTPCVKYREAEL